MNKLGPCVLLKIKLSKCMSNQIAQFLHPIVSLDSTPRLIIKQWARFTRCLLTPVKVHLFLHLPLLQTQPRPTVAGLVQGDISLNMSAIDWVKCLCVSCTLLSKAAVGQRSVPREWREENCQTALRCRDGADAWRGIIIAGTGRLPMGVLAQNLCSLHSMAQFLGELLFFLARHCYHLLPKQFTWLEP